MVNTVFRPSIPAKIVPVGAYVEFMGYEPGAELETGMPGQSIPLGRSEKFR